MNLNKILNYKFILLNYKYKIIIKNLKLRTYIIFIFI